MRTPHAIARTLLAVTLTVCGPPARMIAQPPLATLRITVTIVDADRQARPVPRHELLISENPTSAAPRRAMTSADGTAELRLKPGNYTVESDQPLNYQGKAYQWAQTLDVVAGRDTLLELTAGNALIETAAALLPIGGTTGGRREGNVSAFVLDWQDSVVTIWSPTRRGSGFLIDARGLIATNQRLVGKATSLEVQLSPTEKVAARVLASDPGRNVAILWIDPKAVATARPVKLGYIDSGTAVVDQDKVLAIMTPVDDEKGITTGTVSRVNARAIFSAIRIDDDSLGAPLFNAAGDVIAITTEEDEGGSSAVRAVRIDEARTVIAAAEKKLLTTEAPAATRLPVEPRRSFDDEALKAAARARTGSLSPYRVPAADFDVSLITPVLVYGARHQGEGLTGREGGSRERRAADLQSSLRALGEFANWEDYVRRYPPVLLIRATPKMVESFWTTIGRVAAQTQGISLPPIKRIKAGFAGMRAFCGETEVTPIHPFKIEQRIGENVAMYEGLYVFDPAAMGPDCGTVRLTLFSDKNPDTGDTRVIDAKILQQIWQDFAPYRAAGGLP